MPRGRSRVERRGVVQSESDACNSKTKGLGMPFEADEKFGFILFFDTGAVISKSMKSAETAAREESEQCK